MSSFQFWGSKPLALRFSFDLGTSSIGWAVYELAVSGAPFRLVDTGVRIFPDGREPSSEGRTGESLAKKRRDARGQRRRRDRFVQRRGQLLSLLISNGLLPQDEHERHAMVNVDPIAIRKRALTEKVSLYEFGRALFHLNQRRGFKSNRKTDAPDEKGKISAGAEVLKERLAENEHETLGSFYASRQQSLEVRKRDAIRIRLDGEGANARYDFYPLRQMIEYEFDLLWARQKTFHADFPDDAVYAQIRHAMFHQRGLKPVNVGRCSYFPEEKRLARAHPLTQERIIYETLNKIRIEFEGGEERCLKIGERDKLALLLSTGKDLNWMQIRRQLKLPSTAKINLEEGGEKKISGNVLSKVLVGVKKPGPLKDIWSTLELDRQIAIVDKLLHTEETDKLIQWLVSDLNLTVDAARNAAAVRLPQGYGSVGKTATVKLLDGLKRSVMVYSEAASAAGLHHSDRRDGEVFDNLPPYNLISELQRHIGFGTGDPQDPDDIRFGRVANPSVHVGLNQLRRVINALIMRHGRPDQIVLELARDLKQSPKHREDAAKRNRENRAANERRRDELLKQGMISEGDRKIGEYLQRMRLWEELAKTPTERRCPYTGEQISLRQLISDEVEIEHILPRSRTLDDSISNKTVSLRRANRLKRNLSPAEAAERYPDNFDLQAMMERASAMPPNKRWRFKPDAMERFNDEASFLDRQLNETRHFSRLAAAYVRKLNPGSPDQNEMDVWVTTGRLTAELRNKWGLRLPEHNRKNRNDYRHHAIDACVIGVIDRTMVKKIADAAAADEANENVTRILAYVPEPYDGFADQINASVSSVVVSHRPDHGVERQLHEDTSYGAIRDLPENRARNELEIGNVVRRKSVSELTENEIDKVRDLHLRNQLQFVLKTVREEYESKAQIKKHLPAALARWSRENSVYRVRTLKPESDIIPIKSRQTGEPYRYVVPAENHHMDIVETPDGRWRGIAVSIFDANQLKKMPRNERREPWRDHYPDAKFIMRLHKNDTVQLFDEDGENRIKRVVRIAPANNRLYLAGHYDSGELEKRHKKADDPFRWDLANIAKLKARRARRVVIDEVGRVRTVPTGKP